jgi:hypothetical protein
MSTVYTKEEIAESGLGCLREHFLTEKEDKLIQNGDGPLAMERGKRA